ncbi:MAG: hypothetical protein SGBAC_003228 [Bacillariaceae sp.]
MSSFQADTDAENGDDLLGISSSVSSSEDVPQIPHIPEMRASRGGIEDNKQQLVAVNKNGNSLRQSEETSNSDLDTFAKPGSEDPVKLYLSKEGTARHHDNTTESSAVVYAYPGNNAPQTIASAILGRQQKLDVATSADDAQRPIAPVSASKASNDRPSNAGAFAIAGRGDEETTSQQVTITPTNEDSAITTITENGNATTDMVHAEIAPDLEALVQQRLQTLQQEQHQIIVAVAATNDGNDSGNRIDHSPTPGFQWTTRNKVLVGIGMLLFAILIAVVSAGSVVAVATQEDIVPIPVGPNTPTNMPTEMSPSVFPTYGPTGLPTNIRQGIIEASLFGDGEDLTTTYDPSHHPEAFQWLVDSDIWVPPPTATNPQGLWRERYFMVAFYFATRGDLWFDRRNWLSPISSVCQWDCVSDICGDQVEIWCNEDDKIQRLTKRGNKMLGTIPSEIMALSMLERIDLFFLSTDTNNFRGILPTSLEQWSRLQFLNVVHFPSALPHNYAAKCDLTGTIPTSIGSMTSLGELVLDENQIAGRLPTELGLLTQLSFLDLGFNKLSGNVPTELLRLSWLKYFDISYNQMTGISPELPSNLTISCMDGNGFSDILLTDTNTDDENRCGRRF